MREFMEQLKLYKEYVLIIVALVGGCLFVINYFATKEALSNSQNTLNRLLDERECWLSHRITVSEVSAAIATLEKERLEKVRLKIELISKPIANAESSEALYKNEQLDQIAKDFLRIDEDLKGFRATARFANESMSNRACSKIPEVRK